MERQIKEDKERRNMKGMTKGNRGIKETMGKENLQEDRIKECGVKGEKETRQREGEVEENEQTGGEGRRGERK